MKRALLLLLLACLLIATSVTAAAYEPTNVIALDDTANAIKTMAKEEVNSAVVAVENVALPAVPIPSADLVNTTLRFVFVGIDFGKTGSLWRVDRGNSRFT